MGTFGHQQLGRANYRDEKNGLTAFVEFNGYIFKKQDFVWGEIHKDGKKVCDILGNYVGFLDFDGVRYWDFRAKDAMHFPIEPAYDFLDSDARNRTDGIYLMTKTVEEAQEEKERIENIQRHDKTLRETCAARREAGGPKFAPRKTDDE